MADVLGSTIAVNAGDFDAVLDFYTLVFGHGPDTAPLDDFLEWQICPGSWLQISTGHERPGANNARVRLEVTDIEAAVERLTARDVPVGEVVVVPDVVSFANFSDHWGNALGFYQLLSPRAMSQPEERARLDAARLLEGEAAADQPSGEGGAMTGASPSPTDDAPLSATPPPRPRSHLPPPGAGVPGNES